MRRGLSVTMPPYCRDTCTKYSGGLRNAGGITISRDRRRGGRKRKPASSRGPGGAGLVLATVAVAVTMRSLSRSGNIVSRFGSAVNHVPSYFGVVAVMGVVVSSPTLRGTVSLVGLISPRFSERCTWGGARYHRGCKGTSLRGRKEACVHGSDRGSHRCEWLHRPRATMATTAAPRYARLLSAAGR